MSALRRVYDFITGGSVVAPLGLGVAVLSARFGAVWMLAVLALTLATSTFERP